MATEDKAERGKKSAIDEHECLKWLDSKKPNSVVHICFGSMANFSSAQLKEIAKALEASGQQFIWVVRKEKTMEKRTIVGGFVTHCGWNSYLEDVCAGVPMLYNEKLVTQILKIGVAVGVQQWVKTEGDCVKREAIGKAIKKKMKGERAEELRNKAKALAAMAERPVAKGGSPYSNLNSLIEELNLRCH
ncbi:hypothetical protein CRYUN_Cryun04dG0057300 [Craigia yunnanensis]